MSHGPSHRSLRNACGVALAAAVCAPVAAAHAAAPVAGYEAFAGCPDREDIQACETIDFGTGSIGLGSLVVPVAQAVHFAGGASNTDAGSFYVADTGRVLAPVSLPLTGGAGGLTGDPRSGIPPCPRCRS
ncbi:MAG: hypothetical protein AAGC46_03605 [Solirubrobacteraceae bacterium]|nr:hypothetical protein [Patulibacter sp.]